MSMDLESLFPGASSAAWTVVLVATGIGCATDVAERRLPNWLTGPLWLSGLVYAAMIGGVAGFGGSLVASVLLAVPFVVLFVCAKGGAGDAKMMAGVGAWLGIFHGGITLAAVAICGGIIGITISLFHREGRTLSRNMGQVVVGMVGVAQGRYGPSACVAMLPEATSMRRMPYGVAIMAGAVAAFIGVQPW